LTFSAHLGVFKVLDAMNSAVYTVV